MKLYNIKMELYIASCQMVLNDLSKVNCYLTERCRIDNLDKKIFCICIEPDLKWFNGKALSSRDLVLKWKELYLKNGILKPYVVNASI